MSDKGSTVSEEAAGVPSGGAPKARWYVQPEALPYLKAALPLCVGLGVFGLVALFGDQLTLVPDSPFYGIRLVHAMLLASLATVVTATIGYRKDLDEMRSLSGKTDGAKEIVAATWILRVVMAGVLIAYLLQILIRKNVEPIEACSFSVLHGKTAIHDLSVVILFIAFLIADGLTIRGMGKALKKCASSDDLTQYSADIAAKTSFARQQFWLVDLPVLVGIGVSLSIAWFLPLLSGWNDQLFQLADGVEDYLGQARSNTLFMCSDQPLTIQEFQSSIGNIFAAGIAMGYLAAHVLMSQLVFITLHFFHRKRAGAAEAPSL